MSEEAQSPKPSRRRRNRIVAMQYLYAWELNKPAAADLLPAIAFFFEKQEEARDKLAFAEELVHGALEHIEKVDAEIAKHAENWSFDRIARVDLAILRLAIYELLYREDIPPVVTINEAIDLSKEYSAEDSKRFINGILDKVKEKLDRPLRAPNI